MQFSVPVSAAGTYTLKFRYANGSTADRPMAISVNGGTPVTVSFPPTANWENLADRAAVWEEVGRVGRVRQKECRWRNRRGERFTILLSAETITLDNAPHVLLLALDITQRKQAEIETLKTLAREKELSQLKSSFVSLVSHEFRTPLGIIQSSAELLRMFYQKMPSGERDEQLDSISRNTRRMAGMMEEILVLSRLDAGKVEFQPAALDLNAFCRRVVDEVHSATNRRCHIELSLNPLPAAAKADERLLCHIFTNLLSNAVKYSEPGATVQFAVERSGHDATCIVRDRHSRGGSTAVVPGFSSWRQRRQPCRDRAWLAAGEAMHRTARRNSAGNQQDG